jgi:two-component system CheB/CheR fusion protein
LENVIDGAVITFVNITQRKQVETSWVNAKELCEGIMETVRESLLVLDEDLRVVLANAAYYRTFGASQEETIGQLLIDLGNGQWSIPQLHRLLQETQIENASFQSLEIVLDFDKSGRRNLQLNARRVCLEGDGGARILLAIEDKTGGTEAPVPAETAGRETDSVDRGNGS